MEIILKSPYLSGKFEEKFSKNNIYLVFYMISFKRQKFISFLVKVREKER